MKRVGALLLAILFFLTACGDQPKDQAKQEKNEEKQAGIQKNEMIDQQFAGQTLKIVSLTKDMEYAAKAFEAAYGCKVELTVKDKQEWQNEPAAFAAANPADIYTIEAADMESWLKANLLLSLNEVSAENYAPYTIAYATDQTSALKALTWSVTPVNLYYRRSVAKTVLGDDSPEMVAAAVANIQAVLDFSTKLQAAGYKIFANREDMKAFYQISDKTEKAVLSAEEQFFLTAVRQMETDYRLAGLQTWSANWFKGMYGKAANAVTGKNIEIFGYVLPSWGKSYVLEKAGDNAENTNTEQNPTWGDWAMTVCPTATFSDGIWLGIHQDSKQAEMAKAFLIYVTQNQAFLEKWLEKTKELPAFLPVLENFAQENEDSFLGGQKANQLYLQTVKEIPAKSAQLLREEAEYYLVLEEFLKGNVATFEEVQAKLVAPPPVENQP